MGISDPPTLQPREPVIQTTPLAFWLITVMGFNHSDVLQPRDSAHHSHEIQSFRLHHWHSGSPQPRHSHIFTIPFFILAHRTSDYIIHTMALGVFTSKDIQSFTLWLLDSVPSIKRFIYSHYSFGSLAHQLRDLVIHTTALGVWHTGNEIQPFTLQLWESGPPTKRFSHSHNSFGSLAHR